MASEQVELEAALRVCAGGSGILRVCCFSFLTKRLVLASVCLVPGIWWEMRGQGWVVEVKVLQACLPRILEPSAPREPEMSRPHVGIGESGPEI